MSPALQKKCLEINERYGDFKKFCETFSPKNQSWFSDYPDKCYLGTAPTMIMTDNTYGKRASSVWLSQQLIELNLFTKAEKMDDYQVKETAKILASNYYYLKTTEFMLFFWRLKSGRYGKFFGAIDPITIGSYLQNFLNERNQEIERYEQERKEREKPKSNGISFEEYCKRELERNPDREEEINELKRILNHYDI